MVPLKVMISTNSRSNTGVSVSPVEQMNSKCVAGGTLPIHIYDRGAQITFLGLNLSKRYFWVCQLHDYFFGFMKCRIAFLGLECEKSLRDREKYGESPRRCKLCIFAS